MRLITMKGCIPCKMVKQYLEENNIQGVDILNVEDNEEIVEQYNIKQTPSMILDDGTVLAGKDNIIDYFDEEGE